MLREVSRVLRRTTTAAKRPTTAYASEVDRVIPHVAQVVRLFEVEHELA